MGYIPVVIDAQHIKDYIIEVEFDNGVKKQIDCQHWLKGPIFEPLKNLQYFRKFFVDGWTISWPNGADIDPETLYQYDRNSAAV